MLQSTLWCKPSTRSWPPEPPLLSLAACCRSRRRTLVQYANTSAIHTVTSNATIKRATRARQRSFVSRGRLRCCGTLSRSGATYKPKMFRPPPNAWFFLLKMRRPEPLFLELHHSCWFAASISTGFRRANAVSMAPSWRCIAACPCSSLWCDSVSFCYCVVMRCTCSARAELSCDASG